MAVFKLKDGQEYPVDAPVGREFTVKVNRLETPSPPVYAEFEWRDVNTGETGELDQDLIDHLIYV